MWLAIVLAFLILVAGYTTLNRTLWIGFALELLLVGGLIAWRTVDRSSRKVRTTGAVLVVCVVAGCALVAAHVQTERTEVDPNAGLDKDLRAKIWPEVLERIQARPLTGYGFGRGLFRRALTDEIGSPLTWHAHNLFLDIALQSGIPGLLLFLLLLGVIVREGWRAVRDGADDASVACGLALLGLVAGMVVRNMTDTLFVRQNALFFWAAVGILIGLIQQRRAKG
jgi:O-antigen ligase